MGLFDIFKKKEQEDVVIENWLEEKELSIWESATKHGGIEDKLQQVIIGSISPFPGEGDLAEEMKTMPPDLKLKVKERLLDLMRNPDFAYEGGYETLGLGEGISELGMDWNAMYKNILKTLGPENMLHLASGDIMSTAWGQFAEESLYRGQSIDEAPALDQERGWESTEKVIDWVHQGYESSDIKSFEGDLPAYFLGLKDPGEYWDEVDFLPKDFTGFDNKKPIYDISEHIGINLKPLRLLGYESLASRIDDPKLGDMYGAPVAEFEVDELLSELNDLKTGKIKAINLQNTYIPGLEGLEGKTSMDLGNYVQSLGYDKKKEMYYLSATDIWDFNKKLGGGSYSKWGFLSPSIEDVGEGVQLYGRHYYEEEEFLNHFIVLGTSSEQVGEAQIISFEPIGRLGELSKDSE